VVSESLYRQVRNSRTLSHASNANGAMTRSDIRTQVRRISAVIHCFPDASVTTGGTIGSLRMSVLPTAQTP